MPEPSYRVNLLPPRLQREGNIDFRRLLLIAGTALLVAVILGGYGIFIINFLTARNELAATRTQLAALRPTVLRVESMHRERTGLEQSMAEYNRILNRKRNWTGLLVELNRVMPVDVWLVDLEIGYRKPEQGTAGSGQGSNAATGGNRPEPPANVVALKGASRTVASIGVLISELNRFPDFQRVRLDRVTEGTDGIQFEITAYLKGGNLRGNQAQPQG